MTFSRVEIDSELIRVDQIIRPGIPGVQIETVHLCHPDDVTLVEGSKIRPGCAEGKVTSTRFRAPFGR